MKSKNKTTFSTSEAFDHLQNKNKVQLKIGQLKGRKKIFYSIWILFCAMLVHPAFSQNPYVECHTPDNPDPQETGTPNICWQNTNFGNNFDPYYIPNPDDPIKTIRLNLHVMQKSDGTSNFLQTDPDHMAHLNSYETHLNGLFTNLAPPEYGGPTGDPYITDSRIRFVVDNISFHQDDNGFTNNGSLLNSYCYENYGINKCNSLNVFICGSSSPSYISSSGAGMGLLGESTNFITLYNYYGDYVGAPPGTHGPTHLGGAPWITMPLLAHEVGHCLGLHHSFSSCSQFSDMDCPQLTTWCNPSNDTNCSNNIMGYSSTKVHLSPLQLGHIHEQLTATWRKKNLTTCDNDPNENIIITQDETWEYARILGGNLIIENNSTLTIKCKVSLPDLGKIIVKQGSTLSVDGGTLTNTCCSKSWSGIEVWGNSAENQNPYSGGQYHQGRALFKNGSIVENADCALTNMNLSTWGQSGGIIQASNSTFRNNRRSVQFMAYQNFHISPVSGYIKKADRSYFTRCTFVNNDDHITPNSEYPPLPMVTMWKVHGVRYSACEFKNEMAAQDSEQRREAIFSIDAHYSIKGICIGAPTPNDPCTSYDPSVFTGFHIAVHASGAEVNAGPSIRNTDFSENMVGIFFDKADHSSAIFNNFAVGNHNFDADEPNNAHYHTALKTDWTHSYTIEENIITGNPVGNWDTHGILIKDGGETSNQLYYNELSNLTAGSIGLGNNAEPEEGLYGLKFLCNKNTGNNNDFELRRPVAGFSYASRYQQGSATSNLAAGNTFSAPDGANSNFVHLDFYSQGWYYYKFSPQPNQSPDPDEMNVANGAWNLYNGVQNYCPSNFPEGTIKLVDVGAGINEHGIKKDDYYNLLYSYHELIDEGNTEGMINDIVLSWPEDAWELRDELMARAPFNSEEVLGTAIDQNIMPQGMMLEVLLANPDALRNGNLINHVQCCVANPFPPYMIDMLNAAQQGQTVRTIMEENLSTLHLAMANKHKRVVQHYLIDTLGFAPDDMLNWLKEMKTLEGRYALAVEHLSRNEYNSSHTVLDSIEYDLRLSTDQVTELAQMRNLVTFLDNVHQDNRNVAQLDSMEIHTLSGIADFNNGGSASARAENILCFHYGICAQPSAAPKANSNKLKKPKQTLEELVSAQNNILAIPNPADQYVQFQYNLLFAKEETYLYVWDIQGRKVDSWKIGEVNEGIQVLDTRKLGNGLYVYEIVQEGKKVKSDKFVVQH